MATVGVKGLRAWRMATLMTYYKPTRDCEVGIVGRQLR